MSMDIIIRQPLGFSEIGRKDNQEDCVYPFFSKVNKNNRFFILCDGMGGHDNGEVASSTVCEALGHYFETHIPEDGVMTVDIFNSALGYAYDCLDKKESAEQKKKIEETAQAILDARALYPDCSLADLYDELTMPPELRRAHQANDRAVMQAYGFDVKTMTESSCVAELMKMYQELTERNI